jgi:DNA-binding SARP family transcriptional activator
VGRFVVRLVTLGQLQLLRDGWHWQPIPVQPKRLALLAYLAFATPTGIHRRDTLLGLFWPEADHDQARRALRQAIHHLRNALGDGVLLSRGEEIRLAEGRLWCDARALDDALRAGHAREALALYGGEFLAGVFVSDASSEFEEWVSRARKRLRERAAAAAWDAAAEAGRSGSPAGALEVARRALELDPDDEAGLRRLMCVLDQCGRRFEGLRAYSDFAQRVRNEYGAEPSGETRALADTLRDGGRPRPPTPRAIAPAGAAPGRPHDRTPALPPSRAGGRRRLGPAAICALFLALGSLGSLAVVRLGAPVRSAAAPRTPGARVVLTELRNHTRDPLIAATITAALRAHLAETPAVAFVDERQVRAALDSMARSGERLTDTLARTIALREGATAYVTGDIAALDGELTVSAQLVATRTGSVLAAVRETAGDADQLTRAVERMSKRLRERVLESPASPQGGSPAWQTGLLLRMLLR